MKPHFLFLGLFTLGCQSDATRLRQLDQRSQDLNRHDAPGDNSMMDPAPGRHPSTTGDELSNSRAVGQDATSDVEGNVVPSQNHATTAAPSGEVAPSMPPTPRQAISPYEKQRTTPRTDTARTQP